LYSGWLIVLEQFSLECRTVIGFELLRFKVGLTFIQSQLKPKPIVTRSHTFSRVLRQLHVITLSFDWFTGFSVAFVIG